MPISPTDFALFEALVLDDTTHREVECGNYLHYASDLLIGEVSEDHICTREDRTYYGSSDYIITFLSKRSVGKPRKASIWELKAPQCFIMEEDQNDKRFRPTKEFIKAENQLIHYGNELLTSDAFRVRCNIMDFDHISLGGIIIGREKDRYTKDPAHAAKAKRSLEIRERILYKNSGIKVLTWDAILEHLRP